MPARADDSPLLAARWVEDSLAASLGPLGGTTLVAGADGSARCVKGAAALREAGIVHPDAQPYLRLADALAQQAGDHAATAALLAARLVRRALEAEADGLPVAASLDGYALAQRQALARLRTLRRDDAGACLATVAPERDGWAAAVLEGLRALPRDGLLDLDAIDVRAGPVGQPAWLEGIVAEPQHGPRSPPAAPGVLLVTEEWKPRPQQDVTLRASDPSALGKLAAVEDRLRRDALATVERLGVGLLACARGIDPELAARLGSRGVLVWTDAPLSALRRLERATGARVVPRIPHARPEDVGKAAFERRPARHGGGWLVRGDGHGATLLVPGANASAKAAAVEDGERLLRAAGLWLREPGAVPGAGRWQREVARSLRGAADVAPGKAPIAIRNAAIAFDALADDLVRNAGGDVLAGAALPGTEDVADPAAGVRLAVVAAFETARQVLRIDGRFAKRASGQSALRGGGTRVGSPKGLPGDIPPLM
ncbi:MAG: archaeal chaperonin [Thermoplasmata archaeon]|nr:archaeal chaperonin [Thermoplasmata archaeon]